MNAYKCNESRFSALVNDSTDDKNAHRYATPGNVKTALENLNDEPLSLDKYNAIIVHVDAPTSIKPEHKKRFVKLPVPKISFHVPKPAPEVPNAVFARKDKAFLWTCGILGIVPSARQASKWRNQKGSAFLRQPEAVRINRRRIAAKRVDNALAALKEKQILEACLMDDRTTLRLDAEKATLAAEKHVVECQAALNRI